MYPYTTDNSTITSDDSSVIRHLFGNRYIFESLPFLNTCVLNMKKSIEPEDGGIKSRIFYNACDEYLINIAWSFVDNLISMPAKKPGESCDGLAVSVDRPYNRWIVVNLSRPAVLRQVFGGIDPNTGLVAVYGTGSGSITIGTNPR